MNTENTLLLEKNKLVEELGVYFHDHEDMTPLSARIFSLIILTGAEGITFEELTISLGASKSSISTNLRLLQNKEIIMYFTKTGERKRYFKIAKDYISAKLEKRIKDWEVEKKLQYKILNFKLIQVEKNVSNKKLKDGIEFTKNYINILDSIILNFKQLKQNYLTNNLTN